MAIGLAAVGLLAFLLGCSGTFAEPQNSDPADKCYLSGIWNSSTGNIIQIYSVSDTGLFSGTFYAGWLPSHDMDSFESPLQGIQHQGPQPTFAFTLSRNFAGKTFVFEGQCLVDEKGKEKLRITWVLFQKKLGSAEENWKVIRVGRSTFNRTEW